MKRMYKRVSLTEIQMLAVSVEFMDDSKCIEELAREIGSLTNGQIGEPELKEVLSMHASGAQSAGYEIEISGNNSDIYFQVFKKEIDYYFETQPRRV